MSERIVLNVHDESGEYVAQVEDAKVLWINRYQGMGEFQIEVPATPENFEIFQTKRNITKNTEGSTGIIEKVTISYKADQGQVMTVSGRTAELLLTKRIFNALAKKSDTAMNVISWSISRFIGARTLPFTVMGLIPNTTVEVALFGETVWDVIIEILENMDAGHRCYYLSRSKTYALELYTGQTRSNVVFSEEFDNLKNCIYEKDTSDAFNAVYVAGAGQGSTRTMVNVADSSTGKDRWERYLEASSDIQQSNYTNATNYQNALKRYGNKFLSRKKYTEAFAGEAVEDSQYRYGHEYEVGDWVKVEMKAWGISGLYRVVEVTEQQDANGYKVQPVFAK